MTKILLAVLVFLLGILFIFRLKATAPVKIPRNQEVKFTATIMHEPKLNDRGQVLSLGDASVYLSFYPAYTVGDKLIIEGKTDAQGRTFNPKIEKVGERRNFLTYLSGLKVKISKEMFSLLPEREATLLVGETIGLTSIKSDFSDELIKTGTIHVVVVSGENLMIVSGVIMAFAKYFGRRKSLAISCIFVFLHAALTGFSAPVVRASLMVLVSSVGIFFGREIWSLWSLLLSALAILVFFPYSIFEISFQLTFAATLGIITIGSFLSRKFAKLPIIGQNAAISISATIFTMPVIFFYFGRVSVISPIANILVTEAVFPIMALGFLAAIFSFIFRPFAQILAFIGFVPAFYFVKVVEFLARLPFAQVEFGRGNYIGVVVFYLGILAAYLLFFRKRLNHG